MYGGNLSPIVSLPRRSARSPVTLGVRVLGRGRIVAVVPVGAVLGAMHLCIGGGGWAVRVARRAASGHCDLPAVVAAGRYGLRWAQQRRNLTEGAALCGASSEYARPAAMRAHDGR